MLPVDKRTDSAWLGSSCGMISTYILQNYLPQAGGASVGSKVLTLRRKGHDLPLRMLVSLNGASPRSSLLTANATRHTLSGRSSYSLVFSSLGLIPIPIIICSSAGDREFYRGSFTTPRHHTTDPTAFWALSPNRSVFCAKSKCQQL
jgi:hypothetical protein